MNRNGLLVLLFVGLAVPDPSASRAANQQDARTIIARAIRAVGGQDILARYGARTWKERAVFHGADGDEQYEASYAAKWPDKLRVDIGDFTLAVNGDKGWVGTKGDTRSMTPEELEEHREGTYSAWVQSLVSLRKTEFKLSVLGNTKVAGRPTNGVKVRHQGHFDVDMYFDGETGLLAMTQTRFKEAKSGREVEQEIILGGYRDEAGIRTPTTVSIRREGKLVIEATLEMKYVEGLDERLFAKP